MQEPKQTIAEVLRKTRLKLNMSITEAARISKLSVARISNWEQGIRVPKYEQIETLAKVYNTRPEYLVGWINTKELNDIEAYKSAHKKQISIEDKIIKIESATNNTAYHKEYLAKRRLLESNLISIIVTDNSSPDEIKKGDELLINTNEREIKANEIFAIYSNETIFIRNMRPLINSSDVVMSSGDKENYPDEKITKEKLDELVIIGKVIRISRDR